MTCLFKQVIFFIKEFEEEPVPDNLVDLMKLKYKEMLEGYWSSN